jgi:hypothetical protein
MLSFDILKWSLRNNGSLHRIRKNSSMILYVVLCK